MPDDNDPSSAHIVRVDPAYAPLVQAVGPFALRPFNLGLALRIGLATLLFVETARFQERPGMTRVRHDHSIRRPRYLCQRARR